jgi:acyl-CoA synthetase
MKAREYLDKGMHTEQRIGWVLDRAARRWPNSPAITFDGVTLSYTDLLRWTTHTARFLLDCGFEKGDRLLWQLPNSLEGVVLQLAAWRVGICPVGVVPIYRQHEMKQIINEMRPEGIAVEGVYSDRSPVSEHDGVLAELGISVKRKIVIAGSAPGWTSFPARPDADQVVTDEGFPEPASASECCLIYFTSGTSSAPKGVMHSSQSILSTAHAWRDNLSFSSTDCTVLGTPFARLATVLTTVVIPALCGARAVLMRNWTPEKAVEVCESEGGTFAVGAPIFLEDFVARYEAGAGASHRLKGYMAGGAAVPPDLIRRAQAVGVTAWRGYGMTELAFATFNSPLDPVEKRAMEDGTPSEGTEVEIVDSDRNPLGVGQLGEIRLRSPFQMIGYSDPAQHAASVDKEGWFYTGDIGELSASGGLNVRGRLKDLINRGGEKFSSLDIEQLLLRHPLVAEAAVVSVPDKRFGEAILAVLKINAEQKWPGESAMVDHLRNQNIDPRKIPTYWTILSELPRTLSGKVHKYALQEAWRTQAHEPAGESSLVGVASSIDPNR